MKYLEEKVPFRPFLEYIGVSCAKHDGVKNLSQKRNSLSTPVAMYREYQYEFGENVGEIPRNSK
jgi:hypothetical protein